MKQVLTLEGFVEARRGQDFGQVWPYPRLQGPCWPPRPCLRPRRRETRFAMSRSFHRSPAKGEEGGFASKEAKHMGQLRVQEQSHSGPSPDMQRLASLEQPVAPRVRYIGSKARIADAIITLFGKPQGTLVDACSGTG